MNLNDRNYKRCPEMEHLCSAFPRQIELAVITDDGEFTLELRIANEKAYLAREPMSDITDLQRAAHALTNH